jgi:hypothetical protein
LEIDVNPLDFLLGKTKPASRGSVPGFPPPPKGRFPASFGAPRVPITSAATGTSSLLGPVATLADIYYQGSKVFNPKDNIITSIQDLSTSIGNQFAKPGQEGRYVGSNPIAVRANRELDFRNRSYYGPAYASAQALGLGGSAPSLRNYGPGYKEEELAAGAAAERFRPGAGFPGQQGAADRAYQQELSRTAQLAAQDPELQRYEKARSAAKTQEEMNSVRDMGLAMWAKANPKLAAKVQPGQSGFDTIYKQTGQVPTPTFNPLMERTFPGMSRGAGEYTMGPSPLVPQVDQALNPASPTYALGEGPSLMNFSDENVTPEMIKAFQEQLLKQAGAK